MTFDHDDPKWTAYVLGELDDSEAEALERELAENPEARAFVAALRETTDAIALELGAPTDAESLALTERQRQDISRAAGAADAAGDADADAAGDADADAAAADADADIIPIKPRRRRTWMIAGVTLAAAAGVLVMTTSGLKKRDAGDTVLMLSASESPGPATLMAGDGEYREGVVLTDSTTSRLNEILAGKVRGNTHGMLYYNGPAQPHAGYAAKPGVVDTTLERDGRLSSAIVATPTTGIDANQKGKGAQIELLLPTDGDKDQARDKDPGDRVFNTEAYDHVVDNSFVAVADDPRSTFSIDVDTASYANIRRHLQSGARPPRGAVRIEEMVNYFSYQYPGPTDGKPFAVHVEMTQAPWQPEHKLLKIGIKGREMTERRPRSNLVFLLDVSGSMEDANKLPLLRRALSMLVERLDAEDRVAIVVYAGASGLVLPSTAVADKHRITSALERLQAGGSTNGGEGIELAYRVARDNFIDNGVNRVILATDGDFNVGTTSRDQLVRLIEAKAKSGVFLTVLGFGMGNYKDATLEQLADHGNGNYAYIDTINEARKVLVDEISSTLVAIAKDVKIQLEFNPLKVARFRLIGYENRVLAHQDFNDDTKDAGEIGAGHTVTALYELVPVGASSGAGAVDALKYQRTTAPSEAAYSDEILTLKLRYKDPDGDTSKLAEWPIRDRTVALADASRDLSFAAAVAAFGMILRDSEHKGSATLSLVQDLATRGAAVDRHGYRAEFLQLVDQAKRLGVR